MIALALFSLCVHATALADGIALYQSLEFERAAIHFQGIALDAGAPPTERAQAAMWAGLSLGQLGDVEGARKAFALAVATDPLVRAPDDSPPALRTMLEEERARAPSRTAPAPPIAPPAAAPVTPAPRPAPTSDDLNWGAVGAGTVAGALVVAAAAVGAYGAVQYATSADPSVPARPAFEAYDLSVAAGWAAVGLGSVAAVAGGVSAALYLVE